LLAGALAVTAVARRSGVSPPLLLVVVGLAVSFVPGIPDYTLDPDLILLFVLPPLLYSAALSSSYLRIRDNILPSALLAVGLVLVTTVAIGLAASWLLPGLPLAAALALGAVSRRRTRSPPAPATGSCRASGCSCSQRPAGPSSGGRSAGWSTGYDWHSGTVSWGGPWA
jgi:hypothetical protein